MEDAANNGSGASSRDSEGFDAAGERLELWGRRAGRFLASAAARAREELEDMLAEAQSIRRGERD